MFSYSSSEFKYFLDYIHKHVLAGFESCIGYYSIYTYYLPKLTNVFKKKIYIIYLTLVAHYSLIPGNAAQSKKYEMQF